MSNQQQPKKESVFENLAAVLGSGFDLDLMREGDQFGQFDLDDIEVTEQVRTVFSRDGESTMEELTDSVKKHGVFQPVLLRILDGCEKPYRLVAGGRRYLASLNAGKKQIPALAREMTDDEEKELQFVENIQRLNLSALEEAKRIQIDLDTLGSTEAVLAKYNKTASWLSKVLGLLTLPKETNRLITENISADKEVIGMVKQVEKVDEGEARKLVDDLKASRGKEDARAKVKAVKDKIKGKDNNAGKDTSVATKPNTSYELPGIPMVTVKPSETLPPALMPGEVLNRAYIDVFEHGKSANKVIKNLSENEKNDVETWLRSFYDAGSNCKNLGRATIEGFRKGTFSSDGEGALAFIAFLAGADSIAFNVTAILATVES